MRFVAELNCLLCGRGQGSLEAGTWPPRGTALLRRSGAEEPAPIADWGSLRCDLCGGAVMVVEVTRQALRSEVRVDWDAERPRRGRPPKLLVAQRVAGVAGC